MFSLRSLLRPILLGAVLSVPFAMRAPAAVLQDGEVLQYRVSYGYLRLGTVQIRTVRDDEHPSRYRIIMLTQSNPSIPFITSHEYNESWLNATTFFSEGFYGKHDNTAEREVVRIAYEPSTGTINYTEEDLGTGAVTRRDTLRGVREFAEGPTLLFRARQFLPRGGTMRVPTFVRGHLANTSVTYAGGWESIEIPRISNPVRARRIDATADWNSTSNGLSGAFTAWLSDDEAAIPLRTEMKISVGSITLELEKWTRDGWTPPTPSMSTR